jgi:hypothetical protein
VTAVLGLAFALAAAAGPAARAAAKPSAPPTPPLSVNIVHHRLKRGTPPAYQALEATIVNAYERAKVPLYWVTFQSTKDPRDILYLNVFDSQDGLTHAAETYRTLSPSHPELGRLSSRLAAMLELQTSLLTTRRQEVAYTRPDVDFQTLRALTVVTFRVKPGHEGKFMEAVRKAAASGAPWIVYEANEESTFVLLAPMRTRAEAKRAAPIPRPLREMRGVYVKATTEVYALMPSMSRLPTDMALARSKNAVPKPKAH